jgi:hypothetical protein
LEKNALTWFQSWCKEGWVNNGATWEDFKAALREQFMVQDPKAVARSKLFALHQKGSLRDFTVYFKHLATVISTMSDADLLQLYLDRLQHDLAMNVRTHFPKTLAQAIKLAEEYTNIIGDKGRSKAQPVPLLRECSEHTGDYHGQQDTRGDDPMDVGSMQVTQDRGPYGLTRQEADRRFEEGLCYICESPDHQARHCPDRRQRRRA